MTRAPGSWPRIAETAAERMVASAPELVPLRGSMATMDVLAIILFPVGLLALIAKKERVGVITMTRAGERTSIQMSGLLSLDARDRINAAIRDASWRPEPPSAR